MDTFEKQMMKKQLESLKAINASLANLCRKIDEVNSTLKNFNGIAILPTETVTLDSTMEKGENDDE